jgi:mono/diheme cytochrome c family protein
MRSSGFVVLLNLLALSGVEHSFGQASASPVERGRYLVNEVGKCADCHTARVRGVPDKSNWLKGSVLEVKPLNPVPGWATSAPDLTSSSPLWRTWGESAMVQFFTTGHTPGGKPAAPPMPSYTLTEEDSRAIVAYLKSLP